MIFWSREKTHILQKQIDEQIVRLGQPLQVTVTDEDTRFFFSQRFQQ